MSPPFITMRMLQAAAAGGGVADILEFGTELTLPPDRVGNSVSIAFDPNNANKFIATYLDRTASGYKPAAVVGTISGSSISYGTEYFFDGSQWQNGEYHIKFDPNNSNTFIILYGGRIVAGTISGSTLSFGTPVVVPSDDRYSRFSFDPNTSGQFVVVVVLSPGQAWIGTLSGTAITFGSSYSAFHTTGVNNIDVTFDPNTANKLVVVYNIATGTGAVAKIGTISGGSISFGTAYAYTYQSTSVEVPTYHPYITFDPNNANKFLITYRLFNNQRARVGTISGSSISYGTEYVLDSNTTSYSYSAVDPNNEDKFVLVYNRGSVGYAVAGTMSGSDIEGGTAVQINVTGTYYPAVAFDPNTANHFVVVFMDDGSSGEGHIRIGTIS